MFEFYHFFSIHIIMYVHHLFCWGAWINEHGFDLLLFLDAIAYPRLVRMLCLCGTKSIWHYWIMFECSDLSWIVIIIDVWIWRWFALISSESIILLCVHDPIWHTEQCRASACSGLVYSNYVCLTSAFKLSYKTSMFLMDSFRHYIYSTLPLHIVVRQQALCSHW